MPFPVGAELLAKWTPSHEQLHRWLRVTVIEEMDKIGDPPVTQYRCQTDMGVTMVLPENDLTEFPADPAKTTLPVESDFGEP